MHKVLFLASLLTLSCFKMALLAQTFQADKQGYIADPKFKELIKTSGYQLVGAFVTLPNIPSTPTKAPVRYAEGFKGGRVVYLTPNGKEVDINTIRQTYIPASNTGSGASSEITIAGPTKDEDEKFEQVVVNGKYGTRNIMTKKMGLPAVYDEVSWYHHGLISIKANGKEGFATTEGKILLEPKYESIVTFGPPDKKGKYSYYHTYQNNKSGLMDGAYKEILPPVYDMVNPLYLNPNLFTVQNNKLQGLVDQHGKLLTQVIYSRFMPSKTGSPIVATLNSKKGLIDSTGKVLIDPVYDEITYNGREKNFRLTKGRKYGIANEAGKIVVQPELDYIYDLKDNIAIVKKDDKFGALNEKWDVVMPLDYDKIYPKGSYLYAQKGDQASLFDLKGKKVVQGKFEEIYSVGNRIVYKADGKYGVMTPAGKKLKMLEFDSVVVENEYLIVVKNGKYGVIDIDGHEYIPIKYDFFIGSEGSLLRKNLVVAKLGGKQVILDFYGNEYTR